MSANREGSKLRAAALAVVSAAVPTLTFANHADPTVINCYSALRARRVIAGSVATEQSKALPCVSFQTLDGQEIIYGTGNKRVPLVLLIESSADADDDLPDDDPAANHDALVSAICDVLNDEDIAATLTAAGVEFYAFQAFDMGELDCEAEEGVFKTAHRWDVVCANANLS